MNARVAMEDASRHVRTQWGHSTALVKLATISTVTSVPVMILMNVLSVIHALANALTPLDHSSVDVVVVRHMIQSLIDVLHQITVLVTRVSIDVSVVAALITATVCQAMTWQQMVVVVMTSMNASLLTEDVVILALTSQAPTSALAIPGTHLTAMAAPVVVYSAQIHLP